MNKTIMNFFLACCAFGVLTLILYLYFGDSEMKSCFLLKIAIALIFVVSLIMAVCLIFCNSCEKDNRNLVCNCVCNQKFCLRHENKNETVCTKSNNLAELLQKSQNDDLLYFLTDDYSINSEMLEIKTQEGIKKISLSYKDDNVFQVKITNKK